jgi:hypothetical protein
MKALIAIASIVLAAVLPAAAQSKVFEQTVRLSSGGTLQLDTSKGSLRLTGWDRDQVEIHARIEAEGSWDSTVARRTVDSTTIEVISSSNSVRIRSNYDNVLRDWLFGQMQPSIHYEIRAPRRVDLRLNVDRSNSIIKDFAGRIELEADRSIIDAADLSGPMRLNIDRGGDSSFRNFSGSFDVEADRTNIRIDLAKLDASSRITIDRGNIDMAMPRAQGLDLDTSLSKRTAFDSTLPLQSRRFNRNNPSGTVNGGGPRLAIAADRSHVRLR